LSSSFVIEPRMGALKAAMGAGEGGTEAMQRLVHAAPTCLPAAGKRAIAGRKRVIIIGGGCTLHAKTQYRAETNRVIKLSSLPRDRGRNSNETPDTTLGAIRPTSPLTATRTTCVRRHFGLPLAAR
jgi:hypothetical protein